jgi:hypothetical protein
MQGAQGNGCEGKYRLIDGGNECDNPARIGASELRLRDQGRQRRQVADAEPEQEAPEQ